MVRLRLFPRSAFLGSFAIGHHATVSVGTVSLTMVGSDIRTMLTHEFCFVQPQVMTPGALRGLKWQRLLP